MLLFDLYSWLFHYICWQQFISGLLLHFTKAHSQFLRSFYRNYYSWTGSADLVTSTGTLEVQALRGESEIPSHFTQRKAFYVPEQVMCLASYKKYLLFMNCNKEKSGFTYFKGNLLIWELIMEYKSTRKILTFSRQIYVDLYDIGCQPVLHSKF